MKNPRLKYAGIPRRFESASLEDFHETNAEAVIAVKNWIYSPDAWTFKDLGDHGKIWMDQEWRCLLINGPVGVGKTHLACAVAAEYCLRRNAHYTTAYAMSRRIMADKNADFFNEYSLLIIDEINRTYETQAEQDRFFDLVNYRYENQMPMILVGNIDRSDLRERIGAAIADRMGENLTFVTLAGESRRNQEN